MYNFPIQYLIYVQYDNINLFISLLININYYNIINYKIHSEMLCII